VKKILESKVKIRFHDCDPFNHLNNSRYIDYIMTARGDQLIDHYGFDIYKHAQEKGLGWVSAHTQIAYLSPARVMEEVIVQTRLLHHSEKSLLLEACMWSNDATMLKAVLWTKLVYFDIATQRSHQHDAALMELFGQVVHPLPGAMSFDERIKNLKQTK
jgi:acyl-CoA thioester hydrolase